MIKLSGKAKVIIPIVIVAAALSAGLLLDRFHEDHFTVERLKPGEKNDYAEVVTEEPQRTADAVDINTATVKELTALDGIGEGLAGRIVRYREEHGAFLSVDELLNVSGIGESKLDAIRDMVCVK